MKVAVPLMSDAAIAAIEETYTVTLCDAAPFTMSPDELGTKSVPPHMLFDDEVDL